MGNISCRVVRLIVAAFVCLALWNTSRTLADAQPVPPAAAQTKAEAMIKQLFRKEYALPDARSRLELARVLLDQGEATTNDAAARYVCYRESCDRAAKGGDVAIAFRAIEATGRDFAIDPKETRKKKLDVLLSVAAQAATPEANARLTETGLSFVGSLIESDDYADAERLLRVLAMAANKTKQLPLVSAVETRRAEMGEAQKLRPAREAAKLRPDDGQANLLVGRNLAFVKGDWVAALPFLTKCSEATLRELAVAELAGPADAAGQMRLGNGWWDASEKMPEPARSSMRKHAVAWYERAWPGLSAVAQNEVTSRLPREAVDLLKFGGARITEVGGHRVLDLLPVVKAEIERGTRNNWKAENGVVSSNKERFLMMRTCYRPPEEYDYCIEFTRNEGVADVIQLLVHDAHRFNWQMGSWKNTRYGFATIRGEECDKNSTGVRVKQGLANGRRYTAVVKVRKGEISGWLDGQLISMYKTDYSEITPGSWNLGLDELGIGSNESATIFHRIEVTEITGRGEVARRVPSDARLVRQFWNPRAKAVRFSPDARWLLTGHESRAWILFALGDERLGRQFEPNRAEISPNGQYICAKDRDNGVCIYDAGSGKQVGSGISGHQYSVSFSPDGHRVAIGLESKEIAIWDLQRQTEVKRVTGLPGISDDIAFSADSRYMVSGSANKSLLLWDAQYFKEIWRIETGAGTRRVSFSRDGSLVLVTMRHGDCASLLNSKDGKVAANLQHSKSLVYATFTPDGRSVFSGGGEEDCAVKLWDAAKGTDLDRFTQKTGPVTSVAVSPDGRRALAGCKDGALRLLEIATGKQLTTFTGHDGPIVDVTFSADGKQAATACDDGYARVFKLPE